MKYETYQEQDKNKYWRWRLRAGNNQIIASGEAYYNEADCNAVINLVKSSSNAPVVKLS